VCDRVNKRKLILVTQIAATIQALVLAVLTSTGHVQSGTSPSALWRWERSMPSTGPLARRLWWSWWQGRPDQRIALNSAIFNGSRIFDPPLPAS